MKNLIGFFQFTLPVLLIVFVQQSAESATFNYNFEATALLSANQTFTGNGSISFEVSPTSDIGDLTSFTFDAFTVGRDITNNDVVYQFSYGLADVLSVSNLASAGPVLTGFVQLQPGKPSTPEGVIMGSFGGGMALNFSTSLVDSFCFTAVGFAQCVIGGGSSSNVEANLSSSVIPLPTALPLFTFALGWLGLVKHKWRETVGL